MGNIIYGSSKALKRLMVIWSKSTLILPTKSLKKRIHRQGVKRHNYAQVYVCIVKPLQSNTNTWKVFEQNRPAKPAKLLVVADSPRNAQEAPLYEQARKVTEQIDWDCEVLRDYSDINPACRDLL
jgi:hypothetical protein